MGNKPTTYAKNKSLLADALGISYGALDRYLKMRGAPQRHNSRGYPIEKVRTFVESNTNDARVAQKLEDGKPSSETSTDAVLPTNWKQRKERALALKAEHELKINAGAFLLWEDFQQFTGEAIVTITKELRRAFESTLPPQCEGLKGTQIRQKNAQALDRILESFNHKLLEDAKSYKGNKPKGGRPTGPSRSSRK
tara:strand:- start:5306 stop:5890 length:585 start_codon:yes stop_codon:yes gene_type:complete